jgi:ABC-2 type transport system permease protein
MSAFLRAELLKLRTTRTFLALAGSAAAIGLLISGLSAALSNDLTEEDVRSFVIVDTSGLFILLLGVIGMSGEWRHRTITSTVLAAPDRLRLLAAKLLAYAAAGVALSLLVNVLCMAVATAILAGRGEETLELGDLADLVWRNLVLAALFGALGVGLGGIVRNQAVAVVLVLLTAFAIEPAILALAPAVGRFGPLVATPTAFIEGDSGIEDADLLAPGVAVAVLLGWIAALAGASAALLQSRDLT